MAIGTAVIVLLIIVLLIKSFAANTQPIPAAGQVRLIGEFACLPLKDNVPETEPCKLGVKSGGNYYAIDASAITLAVSDLKANENIDVAGNFVPTATITNEEWNMYDIAGLINLDALTRGR
ncbi:MAG: hypothetical protein M3Q24_01805 [bacterium]|nr:hypothetical protein [bacterium]